MKVYWKHRVAVRHISLPEHYESEFVTLEPGDPFEIPDDELAYKGVSDGAYFVHESDQAKFDALHAKKQAADAKAKADAQASDASAAQASTVPAKGTQAASARKAASESPASPVGAPSASQEAS